MPPPIIGCVLRWKGTHLAPQKHKCWKSQPWQQWKKQAYKKTTKKNFLLGLKNPSFLRTLPPFLWTLMVTPVGTHPIKSTRKDHEIQRSGPMVKILKTCHFCVGCLKTGPSKRLIVVLVSPVFFYHPHILRLGGLPGVVWHCHCYIVAFLLCTYIYIYTPVIQLFWRDPILKQLPVDEEWLPQPLQLDHNWNATLVPWDVTWHHNHVAKKSYVSFIYLPGFALLETNIAPKTGGFQ